MVTYRYLHLFKKVREAYCTSPSPEQPVRSLRKVLGRGTAPWNYADEHSTQFFGAESLVEQAVLRGHPLIVQSHEEATWLLSEHIKIIN